MTTERIDIIIREDGSRVVRRNIEDIGKAASDTDNTVKFLKRTLGSIAFGLAAKEVLDLIDSYTNLQNRLRGVGLEGQTLTQVYTQLRGVANSTRSSLENSVEIYSRLALNSRELGASQQELITFTKSLNQAIILSGASVQEAKGALIQFSQGMASGTLRGDELRSVLEQLPAVADVIARQFGVTRGELRKLGTEGKITSAEILEAFRKAAPSLEDSFRNTIPTISQSFQVLKNNVVDFVGRLDESLGFSRTFSKLILEVANNLDALGDAVKRVSIVLATLASAFGAFVLAAKANVLIDAVAATIAYSRAVAEGSVITLGSVQAEQAKAALIASNAAAQVAAYEAINAASLSSAAVALESAATNATAQALQATAARTSIETLRQNTLAKLAATQVERTSTLATIQAAEAAGALSFALATKRDAIARLSIVEAEHAALLQSLNSLDARRVVAVTAQTEALVAQTAAQTALNAARGRAAVAQGSAAAAGAAASSAANAANAASTVAGVSLLSQAFSKFKSVIGDLLSLVGRFFGFLNSNPFTVIIVSLITVTGLLLGFGDKIDAGIDGITTMQFVLQALGEFALSAFNSIREAATDLFGPLLEGAGAAFSALTGITGASISAMLKDFGDFYADTGTGFAGVVRAIAKTFDAIGGFITGMLIGIGRAFGGLPEIFRQGFNKAYNIAAGIIEDLLNVVISGLNRLRTAVGLNPIELIKFDRKAVDEKAFEKYGQSISESIDEGFKSQGGFLLNSVNKVFDRAQELSRQRAIELFRKGERDSVETDLTTKGKGSPPAIPVDTKGLDKAKNALRSLLDTISPTEGAVLQLGKAYETLQAGVEHHLLTQEESNKYFQVAVKYYLEAINPLAVLNKQLDEQTRLLGFNNREREIEAQLSEKKIEYEKKNIPFDVAAQQALRERFTALRDLNEIVSAQDKVLEDSVEKRRKFTVQLIALQNLLKDPTGKGLGVTPLDAVSQFPDQFKGSTEEFQKQIADQKQLQTERERLKNAGLLSQNSVDIQKGQGAESLLGSDLFKGTQEQIDLQVAQFNDMYARIKILRDNDVISEETAAIAKARVAAQQREFMFQGEQKIFDSLASLATSGNKKLAAIGRAAAIANATRKGYEAVNVALASAPPPLNYFVAAAVGIEAAANVAKIAGVSGFQAGGYTGDAPINKVAGVVHGREFVVNAAGTARNRGVLEAINKGQSVTNNSFNTIEAADSFRPTASPLNSSASAAPSGKSDVKVIVNNNAPDTRATTNERDTPNGKEIEVTIERVVVSSIKKGGAISGAIEGQYGLNRAQGVNF